MTGAATDVRQTIEQAKDAMTVRRVFGDPYERGGLTVIPAARVQGGPAVAVGKRPMAAGQVRAAGSP